VYVVTSVRIKEMNIKKAFFSIGISNYYCYILYVLFLIPIVTLVLIWTSLSYALNIFVKELKYQFSHNVIDFSRESYLRKRELFKEIFNDCN
jgi:hypothetical protein